MAVVEPYAPCPCGSGEKFKWCCHKVEDYAVRAQRLFDNGQIDASLIALDEGLRKNPDNAWLSLRKAIILARRNEFEPAKGLLRRVVQKRPNHVGAQAFLVRLVLLSEGASAGAGQLQQALGAVAAENRSTLWIAAEMVGGAMIEEDHLPAAIAHLVLAASLMPEDADSAVESTLRMIEANAGFSPWLRNPYELSPVPDGIDESKCHRFQEAIDWADEGRWAAAAARFDTLSAEGTPESDRNLGLCRLWLGDDPGAVEALRRYTSWVGASPDNVDLEALCQIIAPLADDEKVELLQWIWPVRDHDALMKALHDDPRARHDGRTPMEPDDPDSFEVDLFILLDKPAAEGQSVSDPTSLPIIEGRVLVGREIVALEAHDDGRLDRLAQRFKAIAGESIAPAHPRTKVLGESRRSALALRTEWLMPEGIGEDEMRRVERLERRRVLTQVWPETPMPYLGNRTPRQAAKDGDAALALRAALCQFEVGQEFFREDVDFTALRRELGIEPEPPIDPESVEIDQVHLARLHRVPAEKLDDDRLVALFIRSHRYLMPQAMEQAAQAMVHRPELMDREGGPARFTVFADLANLALSRQSREEAFTWVRRGRESDPDSRGANAPRWDMLEVRMHARIDPPDQWVPLLAAVMERYRDSDAAGPVLASNLLDMGLLQMQPHPDRPGEMLLDSRPLQAVLSRYGPRITTASGELGVSATRSGLWTPGSETGAPGGLWTPGSSPSGNPDKGGEKPSKLFIPGR